MSMSMTEKITGLSRPAILLLMSAIYASCLVFPQVNAGQSFVLALGIAGFWGFLFAAKVAMGGWRKLMVPMTHGAGLVFMLFITAAITITCLALLVAIGLIPAELVFKA